VQAVRVGGRLTGLSAIHALGGWMLDPPPLHVSLSRNAARLRSRWNRHRPFDHARTRTVVLHWESPEIASRGTAVAVGLRDALVRVMLDETAETAIAVLDWATHAGLLDEIDLAQLGVMAPASRRHAVTCIADRCDSFPESIARTRLLAAGHRVRAQVPLDGFGPIDLVIDDHVALEIDGREFHADTFEQDSAKSLGIALAGYVPFRASATLVLRDWDAVLRAIEILLGNSGVVARPRVASRAVAPPRRGRRAATPEIPIGSGRARLAGGRSAAPSDAEPPGEAPPRGTAEPPGEAPAPGTAELHGMLHRPGNAATPGALHPA
jgi:very-short-patch-repair endonuclease